MKKQLTNSLSPASTRAARSTRLRIFGTRFLVLAAASLAWLPAAQGVILTASDNPTRLDYFGLSVGISGTTAMVAAPYKDSYTGAVYLYTGVDSGTPTETKLTASDEAGGDYFGSSVGISGSTAVVGASGKDFWMGAVYIYTGIGLGVPTVTQLTYPGTEEWDGFGSSVGISGTTAIVGTRPTSTTDGGQAYIYTGIGLGVPTVTQLTYPGTEEWDGFGSSVGISGTTAIVGAECRDSYKGAAYLYTGIDSGTPTETKLTASDEAGGDYFGSSVGISGTTAIVGAYGKDSNTGAAYLYTGVDSGTPTETKLTASDNPTALDHFGSSVGISGTTAIVGAAYKGSQTGSHTGAAYIYTGVNTGTTTETLKLTPSDGADEDYFGISVSIDSVDGDNFIVGAVGAASGDAFRVGKAYTGKVSTFTTVNSGNITRATEGLSFVSQTDWIIGNTTSNNTVTLSKVYSSKNNLETWDSTIFGWFPDIADVKATGKAVYIGKSNGTSGNKLIVEGILRTNKIYIGSANGANNNTLVVSANTLKGNVSGNIKADEIHIGSESSHGNVLKLEGDLSFVLTDPTTILLHKGNMLIIWGISEGSSPEGEELPLTPAAAATMLADASVQLKAGWLPDSGSLIIAANAESLISTSTSPDMRGYTIIRANGAGGPPGTPEPSTYALWGSSLLAGLVFLRHRRRRKG